MRITTAMRTLGEKKAEALARLASLPASDIRRDILQETAIDLDLGGDEAGFVVQAYPDGIIRRATFFIGRQEVPLTGADIQALAPFLHS